MNAFFAAVCYCIVGSNPGAPDKEALHVLECDDTTGAAKIVQTVKGVEGTTYFQVNKKGDKLYSFISEKRDGKKRGAAVVFDIKDNRIGEMTKLATLPCEVPCHVAISPNEKSYAFAAYTSGCYGLMSLTEDGGICDFASSRLANIYMGPREDRQKKAYAHCMVYTPEGKMIGVIDLGCDRIFFYDYPFPNYYFLSSYSAIRCRPHFPFSIKSDPGDGPRHAIFSRCGKYFFVLNELSSSVTSYAYDGKRKFTHIGKWSMLPKGTDPLTTKAAAIKLTADGKVLMASNRGCDSIAFFEVKDNGELELKNIAPLKGKFPRDFELMPGEKFMVVGHKMSNEIQVYSFDRAKYTLTPVGDAIPCYRPLCFKFLP